MEKRGGRHIRGEIDIRDVKPKVRPKPKGTDQAIINKILHIINYI